MLTPGRIISVKHGQPMSQTKNVLYKNKEICHKNLKKHPDKSDTKQAEIPIHDYKEFPHHFLGSISIEKQLDENNFTTEAPADFIIDKQTLKGAFYKVENDYLGNLPISWFSYSCSNGYYTANMEPVTLKETLEKYLVDAKDISAADRERIQKLADSIHENDNNYILYAKLK